MCSVKISIESSNLVKKSNPLKDQLFRFLVSNVDSPIIPKSANIFYLSRSLNSYFSATTGLISSNKISIGNVILVKQDSMRKIYFRALGQNPDSPKIPKCAFKIKSSRDSNKFISL